MKCLIKLTILAALLYVVSLSEAKRSDSVMEFFTGLYTKEKKKATADRKTNYKFRQDAPAEGEAKPEVAATNSTEILSDWLRISSPLFKSGFKFPPILLHNGSYVSINVDDYYFRKNWALPERNNGTDPTMPENNTYFWFRLSDTHMYYSTSPSDINILGAIDIKAINTTKESDDQFYPCFDIEDKGEINQWKICANDTITMRKWVCAIKKALNISDILCNMDEKAKASVTVVVDEKVIQPIILVPLPSKQCNEKWNYNNHGKDWNCICAEGREQSPIDLPLGKNAIVTPIAPLFQYEIVAHKSPINTLDGELKSEQYIKIKYFANALRILHPNMGKIVTLDGAVYVAEEIVFHTPSEHTIQGQRFPLEIQIIHYGQSKGDIANQVVLSFLFEKKAGVYNRFIDDVDFFNLPNPTNLERDITNDLFIPKILYSAQDQSLPDMKPFSFYTYQGSLTFPPCTERTIHYVASDPIPIASAPLSLLQEAIRMPDLTNDRGEIFISDDTTENYREAQPLNERNVFFFDHRKYCGPEVTEPKKVSPVGHYEKVKKKITEYIYVNGNLPSGLPNSFVVPVKEAKGE